MLYLTVCIQLYVLPSYNPIIVRINVSEWFLLYKYSGHSYICIKVPYNYMVTVTNREVLMAKNYQRWY